MRLGEFCALSRGEEGSTVGLEGAGVAGVVGEAGTEGQSSERLSSHGSLLIFPRRVVMMRPRRASRSPLRAPMRKESRATSNDKKHSCVRHGDMKHPKAFSSKIERNGGLRGVRRCGVGPGSLLHLQLSSLFICPLSNALLSNS